MECRRNLVSREYLYNVLLGAPGSFGRAILFAIMLSPCSRVCWGGGRRFSRTCLQFSPGSFIVHLQLPCQLLICLLLPAHLCPLFFFQLARRSHARLLLLPLPSQSLRIFFDELADELE